MDFERWEQDPEACLLEQLGQMLGHDCVVEGERLVLPMEDIAVRLRLEAAKDRMVTVYFYVECPHWDREIVECCVGVGDNLGTAVGVALGSFVFGLMNGVHAVVDENHSGSLTSWFEGQPHHWRVYQSNIIGMGKARPKNNDTLRYWKTVRDGVATRLGNQKICCVKVYGARVGANITGECRINDVASPELGDLVAEEVSRWEWGEEFASQKQFFLLVQEEETHAPYPHTQRDLEAFTRKAIQVFARGIHDEEAEWHPRALGAAVEDPHLAEELCCFLPELCAENAYHQLEVGEKILINQGGEQRSYYKSQLASYDTVQRVLLEELGGLVDDGVYSALVGVSSIHSAVCAAREAGKDLAEGGKLSTSYGFSDSYVVR